MADSRREPVLVIGVGNELRGDDGLGIAVVRRLAERAAGLPIDLEEEQSDPTALLLRWRGRRAVVLVDAVTGSPGQVYRFDASGQALPRELRLSTSSHAVGLDEAIELDRALGQLPPRVIVYAVGGASFDAGVGLSAELAVALPELTDRVLTEALALAQAGSSST